MAILVHSQNLQWQYDSRSWAEPTAGARCGRVPEGVAQVRGRALVEGDGGGSLRAGFMFGSAGSEVPCVGSAWIVLLPVVKYGWRL